MRPGLTLVNTNFSAEDASPSGSITINNTQDGPGPKSTLDPPWLDTIHIRTYGHLFLAAMGMLTLTLTAIIANLLVIVIFFKHRRLRRCKNVYLVGLSLADLGVGLCMPLGLADEMLTTWAPASVLCRVYLVIRDSLLFISLLTVVQCSSIEFDGRLLLSGAWGWMIQ
ncbi:hypothetical protein ACOMHN_040793 [Nucella lapillus]